VSPSSFEGAEWKAAVGSSGNGEGAGLAGGAGSRTVGASAGRSAAIDVVLAPPGCFAAGGTAGGGAAQPPRKQRSHALVRAGDVSFRAPARTTFIGRNIGRMHGGGNLTWRPQVRGVTLFRVRDGRIAEALGYGKTPAVSDLGQEPVT